LFCLLASLRIYNLKGPEKLSEHKNEPKLEPGAWFHKCHRMAAYKKHPTYNYIQCAVMHIKFDDKFDVVGFFSVRQICVKWT